MEPAKWFFRKHEEEPTTEVAIRRALGEDVYVVLAGYDVADSVGHLRGRRSIRSSTGSGSVSRVLALRHRASRCCRSGRSRSRPRGAGRRGHDRG